MTLHSSLHSSAHSIHAAFQAQVQRTPDLAAVVQGDTHLSYRELDRRSDALAQGLLGRGVAPEEPVGVLAGRTVAMVVAVLGVLKAGACYVPIEPSLPAARKRFIVDDTRLRVVLCDPALPADESADPAWADVCAIDGTLWSEGGSRLPWPEVAGDDRCYVMYTSGSTGQPKGVEIVHRGVLNLAGEGSPMPLRPHDRLLLTGVIGFDQTTFELWGALLNGLTLCLPDAHTLRDAHALQQALRQHGITTLLVTAAFCNRLVIQEPAVFSTLRHLMVGGDVLSPQTCYTIRSFCPDTQVVNVYGPTENTTFSTSFVVDRHYMMSVPIGRPLRHTSAHLVDEHGGLIDDDRPGELLVGGSHLARGYLNRPELTRERFVDWPGIGRVYRTGDIARWGDNGQLEYVGRQDRQVKVGGYRIELEEVQAAIASVEGVLDCAVRVWTHGDEKFIAAYCVTRGHGRAAPDAHGAPDASAVRQAVSRALPAYMVPAFITLLDSLPIDGRGKVDLRALPDPFAAGAHGASQPAAPRDRAELEALVSQAWKSALGLDAIGPDQDFHALGGDSIKAVHLMGLMGAHGLEVTLSDLLHHRTLGALLDHLDPPTPSLAPQPPEAQVLDHGRSSNDDARSHGPRARGDGDLTVEQLLDRLVTQHQRNDAVLRQGRVLRTFPMSPIQELQYGFDTPPSLGHLSLGEPTDMALLQKACVRLIRSQSLMRSIPQPGPDGRHHWQEYALAEDAPIECPVLDLSGRVLPDEQFAEFITGLARRLRFHGPTLPYQIIVVKRDERPCDIVLAFHHVLFDRVSEEVITRGLLAHYQALLAGRAAAPDDGAAFHDYVAQVHRGPEGLAEQGLIDAYQLPGFHAAKQQLLGSAWRQQMDCSHAFQIGVPWPRHLEQGCSLGTALALYVQGVGAVFGVDAVPLLFVHEGRQYGGRRYYGMVGELIDYVPMVLHGRMTPQAMQASVATRLSLLNQRNINFLGLVTHPDLKRDWPRIEPLVQPGEALATFDLCMFNYLGNPSGGSSWASHYDPRIQVSPLPLPIHSFLNCIVENHADGFIFNIRSSCEPRAEPLRQAFRDLARQAGA